MICVAILLHSIAIEIIGLCYFFSFYAVALTLTKKKKKVNEIAVFAQIKTKTKVNNIFSYKRF